MVTICSIVLSSALLVNTPNQEVLEQKDCYKIPQLVKDPTPWYKKYRKKTYEIGGGDLTFQFKKKKIIVYRKTW